MDLIDILLGRKGGGGSSEKYDVIVNVGADFIGQVTKDNTVVTYVDKARLIEKVKNHESIRVCAFHASTSYNVEICVEWFAANCTGCGVHNDDIAYLYIDLFQAVPGMTEGYTWEWCQLNCHAQGLLGVEHNTLFEV